MKNAVAILLIFACLGANWPTGGQARLDRSRLHDSHDSTGTVPQEICRGRQSDEVSKRFCFKAIWDLLFPVALGDAPQKDVSSYAASPRLTPSLCTLQSQHVLIRL